MDRYRARLTEGVPAVAAICAIPDPYVAEVLATYFDMVMVDLQHGPARDDQLHALVLAIERRGAGVFARVGWNQPQTIMRALDLGVTGVVVPMVETVEEARAAAGATRYPPLGVRSFPAMRPGAPAPAEANRTVQCFPLVETVAGLKNVAEIVAVDGVDGIFIGVGDLALSMGFEISEAYRSDAVMSAFDEMVSAARSHGKLVAAAAHHEIPRRFPSLRLDWLVGGLDKGILIEGARAAFEAWRTQ
jgi:4-hydroxy-2-oxoheptanedioate aldolase